MLKSDKQPPESNEARNRLVLAGLRLFAEKGFEAATTREICVAAGVNISAIRYYFGDKAGLYRAAYIEPLGELPSQANRELYAKLPIDAAVSLFFQDFLQPLKMGPDINLVMKLRFREMLEPTGAWQQEIEAEIEPQHQAMAGIIKRRLNLSVIDDDIHRLTFAIIGMAVHLYVGQEVIAAIAPQILNAQCGIDCLAERLAGYALAMIEAEAKRRDAGHANN